MTDQTYLQYTEQWDVTLAAIMRLATRLGHPFTYGELGDEILRHDGLKIDQRGYAGALNAVARNTPTNQPLWTVMVVNQETRRPSDGFWRADYSNLRYREVVNLSEARMDRWLKIQQAWCIAVARTVEDPLDQELRDQELVLRERAELALVELRVEQNREDAGTS